MRKIRAALAAHLLIAAGLAALGSTAAPAVADPANTCANSVLASNLAGWGTLDGSWVTRDPVGDLPGVSWAFNTGGRRFYMPQQAVAAGQTWTFSARDRVVAGAGTARIAVDWYGSGGAYLGQQSGPAVALTPAGGPWTPVSATFTAPAGATSAHVLQFGDFGTATGTGFKATMCDYRQGAPSDSAATRYGWGTPDATRSDEYNAGAVDLTKWGLFGAPAGQSTGCSPGFNGHGQRCASQTTQAGGFLSVTGTAGGVTGGLWARTTPFRYGRVEVRERAVPLGPTGAAYNAVPLLWPANNDYTHGEIDFAERRVPSSTVALVVHHDGGQTSGTVTIDSTVFHNYAIDWTPTSVTWYVDGVVAKVVNAAVPTFNSTNGGAQLDMFPDTGTPMRPARQDVDWVRVYPNQWTQYQ